LDQVLLFRKDGDNEVPITPVDNGEMDNDTWIEWASGIWTDINETNVLQHGHNHDRAGDDEKHICPLQLGTIERCIKLYSNPGETVLTPFGGIGSEAYQALKFGRKAILIELKESYFNAAIKNLKSAQATYKMPSLLDLMQT
jgi:DNA modification methylase